MKKKRGDMTTANKYRSIIVLLIFLFTSTLLMGCAHKSANNKMRATQKSNVHAQATIMNAITLGPGDILYLSVWQNEDINGSYKIDSNGNIFIPLVGELKASGRSTHRLRTEIITALGGFIVNPQVQLTVTSYRSHKVYVLGEVKNPGIYQMDDTLKTIISAISAAGGFTGDASANNVVHLKNGLDRGDAQVLRMGSYLLNDHNHDGHLQNAALSGGDVIYVPSSLMANVDGFFTHVAKIVSPVVEIERGIILEPFAKDIWDGKSLKNNLLVLP